MEQLNKEGVVMGVTEKVLILSRDRDLTEKMHQQLKQFWVDVVDVVHEESGILFDELAARYNFIVIDKWFSGNAVDTAILVRRIRRVFFDPIIGFDRCGGGEIMSMKISGCNFILKPTEDIVSGICDIIGHISFHISLEPEGMA